MTRRASFLGALGGCAALAITAAGWLLARADEVDRIAHEVRRG